MPLSKQAELREYLGDLTVLIGYAECGIMTFTQFPHCLSYPSLFHSPKTKVSVVWREVHGA